MNKWRDRLFCLLVILAPFSLVPYLPLPLENFSSLRIGLYQVLAAAFVIAMLTKLKKPSRSSIRLAVLLLATLVVGVVLAVSKSRALIMSLSIGLLVAVLWASWSYTVQIGLHTVVKKLSRPMLWAAIAYALVSLAQLMLASFGEDNYLLCKGCVDEVFGFPRINGFAAEPLFWANALMPFYSVSLYQSYKKPSRLASISLFMTTLSISLTFARGAYLAVGLASLVVFWYLGRRGGRLIRPILIAAAGFVGGLILLVSSAVVGHPGAPYIFRNTVFAIIDHLSLGLVDIPPRLADAPVSSNMTPDDFVSQGLVTASTNERVDSAGLAFRAWQDNLQTMISGVGPGNLGPYVVEQIDSGAPANLTVYIYYILMLAELGVIGIALLIYVFVKTTLVLLRSQCIFLAGLIISFGVHYLFFWQHDKRRLYLALAGYRTSRQTK